jgi:hypothetical protein
VLPVAVSTTGLAVDMFRRAALGSRFAASTLAK